MIDPAAERNPNLFGPALFPVTSATNPPARPPNSVRTNDPYLFAPADLPSLFRLPLHPQNPAFRLTSWISVVMGLLSNVLHYLWSLRLATGPAHPAG